MASRWVARSSSMWDMKAHGALNVGIAKLTDGVNVELLALDARNKAFTPPRPPVPVTGLTVEADNAVVTTGLQQISVLMSC